MVAELPVMLDILADDLENNFFGEEDDDFIVLSSAASTFARKNLNRILGYFEQTIATYSLDEFKAHFRMQRATCEFVVREVTATGNIPAGNPFGRHVIDPRKQILIYLWCMANQESVRLVADRFNVTFSSVTRVMHRVTKKRPPTLPMRKDTHCIDKCFGNLPPSFRSLEFFLGSMTVKSLALVSVNKWYKNFREFRQKREKGNTSKGITFFSENIPPG